MLVSVQPVGTVEEQPVSIGMGVYVRKAGARLVLSTAASGAIYMDRTTLSRLVRLAEYWAEEMAPSEVGV